MAFNPNNIRDTLTKITIVTFNPKMVQNHFPATITDYSDSYASQWAATPSYGFQDNVATFQGTSRAIRVSFVLASRNPFESKKWMLNLNNIVQNLYPTYSGGTPKSAPLFGLRIMNWTSGQAANLLMGYVKSFVISPDLTEGVLFTPDAPADPDEIVLDPGSYSSGKAYPRVIPVTFEMTVLHEKRPGSRGGKFEPLGDGFPFGQSPKEITNVLDAMNVNNIALPEGQATTNLAQKLLKSLDDK